nr:PREDICTED: NADH dehydrogenase [ubiquinone] 1 alpha subcomplex subunit 5 [Equus przewalskii]
MEFRLGGGDQFSGSARRGKKKLRSSGTGGPRGDARNCQQQHGSCFVFGQTTGLVGLAVCESPHERLRILYTKILDVLEQIPKNAAYRKYTEQITNEKLGMVKAEPDVKKLEDQLQGGQIEEVILQAENELSLARKMIQWKPWEPLVEEPPANQWKWPI